MKKLELDFKNCTHIQAPVFDELIMKKQESVFKNCNTITRVPVFYVEPDNILIINAEAHNLEQVQALNRAVSQSDL